MKSKKSRSEFEFDENAVIPAIKYGIRHELIEGENGVDVQVKELIESYKKKGIRLSDDELNNYWWHIYRDLLKKKGYSIRE